MFLFLSLHDFSFQILLLSHFRVFLFKTRTHLMYFKCTCSSPMCLYHLLQHLTIIPYASTYITKCGFITTKSIFFPFPLLLFEPHDSRYTHCRYSFLFWTLPGCLGSAFSLRHLFHSPFIAAYILYIVFIIFLPFRYRFNYTPLLILSHSPHSVKNS